MGEVTERVRGNDGRMDLPTLTISASGGWLDQRERFSGNIAGKEQKNYTLLQNGELSYNHGNSKLAKYGVVYALKTFKEALVPRVYHSFKVTYQANADFIEYMFATKLPDRELGKLVSSGARMDGLLNINYEDFMGIMVKLPTIQEQVKISEFLRTLNYLLALHQRKCNKLKELKKGYLQKMFPKGNGKIPVIRFRGFDGEWEINKLGNISKMYQPQTITGDDLLESGVTVFGANGYIGYYSEWNHYNDQVTISARGEGAGTPNYVNGPVWITGNSMVLNTDNYKIDKQFLYANLSANSLRKYVTGGAQPQLTRDVLEKTPITISTYNEQTKIGNFFQTLDQQINQQETKLKYLKQLKQAYLQNMFV